MSIFPSRQRNQTGVEFGIPVESTMLSVPVVGSASIRWALSDKRNCFGGFAFSFTG